MHRLLGRLYAWGDFNALKTSDPSFTAARNTVALGNRIMEELANSCANGEELINNALKLCAPIGLAEHAYLAGEYNSDDNILARIGRKNFHTTTSNYMVNAASHGVVRALCGSVTEAAKRWRTAIQDAEEQGDTGSEVAARCAHMMLASSLLERGELTPSDLAALIDTFQEQKLMKVRTKKGNYCRTMHVGDNEVMYSTLAFPAINVDKLIDFAAARMAVS